MIWALTVAAGLTWLGTLYHLRSMVKRRSSTAVRYLWLSLLFISLSLTLILPPVYEAVNQFLGAPNLSRLLSNASAVLAVLSSQSMVYLYLVSEPRSRRLRLGSSVVAGGVLVAMTLLFIASGPIPETWDLWNYYKVGTVAGYRLTYLGYIFISALMVTALWSRYATVSDGFWLKASFGAMATGGAAAMGYTLSDASGVLGGLGMHNMVRWGGSSLNNLLITVAIVLVLTGATMPVWHRMAQTVRSHVAFLHLRGLWLELRAVHPQVGLAPEQSRWRDTIDLRDATFRLHRQIVEIRDACYMTIAAADPGVRRVANEVADAMALKRRDRLAVEEAALVRSGLGALKEGKRRARNDPWQLIERTQTLGARDGGFWAEVAHLTKVAGHASGSTAMSIVLRRLTELNQEAGAGPTGRLPEEQKRKYA